ncbi:tyrosine-type recombinase/integrase [Vibrio fortis]|uniref:Tyrosine-type recombinase/integrase n=1 Tax=Vibrio fortis TaxID=212667 RepID=A0A5N3S1S1_9VIBR|nr:tyrosine-type recombinase/integrase [Vibrio fortis]KAB0300700.1 tyrosine-type recombinase/integrase [Vibrio fortis]
MITLNSGVHHPATVRCKISDAQIKKHAKQPHVRQLKDERYSVYLRYKKNRQQGSWVFYEYKSGKQTAHVFGKYPNLSAKHIPDVVEHIVKELSTGIRARSNEFLTVDELLVWYLDMETRNGHLSKERLSSLKAMIDSHLISRLHGVEIAGLSHREIEKQLMKPLREGLYSISYIRSIFQALKVAFNQAKKMNKIGHNPLNDMVFTDFVKAKIKPKGCNLLVGHTPGLLEQFGHAEPLTRMLCLMMVSHGTRIGETRKAKWCNICFVTKRWKIPIRDAKTRKEILYPLTDEWVILLQAYKAWQLANHYKGNNLFPSSKRDLRPISSADATQMIRTIANGKWTGHDLRKLARTVWADIGIDYLVAETLLNHAKGKLEQAYIHTHIELQKSEALKTYHSWLKNCWRDCFIADF